MQTIRNLRKRVIHLNTPKFFLSVWAQPIESLPKWKAEGVNVIFPDTTNLAVTPSQRRKACADLGLYYIDTMTDIHDTGLLDDPYCLAVYPNDEPSNDAPFYTADPVGFQKFVDAWKAKWVPILALAKARKPIYVNFAGGHVTAARPWHLGQMVKPFAEMADIVSCDWYPINTDASAYWDNWKPDLVDPISLGCKTIQQYAARLLKLFFPGKQIWSFIEVCKYDDNPKGRAPTPADIQAQADALLKEGVLGISYFADNFKGAGWGNPAGGPGQSDWDGRTADEAAACKQLAHQLFVDPLVDLQSRVSTLEGVVQGLQKNAITGVQLIRG